METRKLIVYGFIIFICFTVGVLIYFAFFPSGNKVAELAEKEELFSVYNPSPTLEPINVTDRITAGGVNVLDFYQMAQVKMSNNDAIIVQNSDFQLVYYARGDYFHLSIINSPFEEVKLRSEKDLLRLLDISQSDVCHLYLTITTPLSVNPQESGKDYPLSFCE